MKSCLLIKVQELRLVSSHPLLLLLGLCPYSKLLEQCIVVEAKIGPEPWLSFLRGRTEQRDDLPDSCRGVTARIHRKLEDQSKQGRGTYKSGVTASLLSATLRLIQPHSARLSPNFQLEFCRVKSGSLVFRLRHRSNLEYTLGRILLSSRVNTQGCSGVHHR